MSELNVAINKIKIFVTEPNGERYEITDLYWFEENGVHDFSGKGLHGERYVFEFEFGVTAENKL